MPNLCILADKFKIIDIQIELCVRQIVCIQRVDLALHEKGKICVYDRPFIFCQRVESFCVAEISAARLPVTRLGRGSAQPAAVSVDCFHRLANDHRKA